MLQLLLNGLAMGAIYALIALGLLQIFNAVRIVNFAQGQLLMLGAFFGLAGTSQLHLPIWAVYLATFAAMAVIGLVFMLVAYYPLRGKPFYLVILTTIAVGIVLENLVLIIWGPLPQSVPSPFGSAQWKLGDLVVSKHVVFIFVTTAVLLPLRSMTFCPFEVPEQPAMYDAAKPQLESTIAIAPDPANFRPAIFRGRKST
jgi:branched-chain amino acid transport system permease protein